MADKSTGQSSSVSLKDFYRTITQKTPLMFGHQFLVRFEGDVPDAVRGNGGSDPTSITYYVKSSTIPSVEISEQTVAFLSQDFVIPKQVQYGDSWKVKVMLDNRMTHYNSLYNWQSSFADLAKDGGGVKTIPNTRAIVELLDGTLQTVVHRYILEGVFPTDVPKLSMQYENASNVVEFECTFNYQYLYDAEDGDPLSASGQGI